jgi:hypothetical protein
MIVLHHLLLSLALLHPLGQERVLFLLWLCRLLPLEFNALKHLFAVAVPAIKDPQRADTLEKKFLDRGLAMLRWGLLVTDRVSAKVYPF